MSVKKHIKFAAPYRSQTFNTLDRLLIGRNGVVSGGEVSSSVGVATVQPLVFVQNGLLIETDASISATIPPSITAPYYIAVSVSSGVENLAEVITPVFVKRPQDVSANTVLVAQWDGQEWLTTPRLQINELLKQISERSVKQDFVGVADGFDVTNSPGTINLSPGSLFDRNGEIFTKTLPLSLLKIGADTAGWDRIDQVVFRRPDDSVVRAGTIQLLAGNTYDGSNPYTQLPSIALAPNALVKQYPKVLIDQSNNKYYFWLEDVPASAKLRFNVQVEGAGVMSGDLDLATGGVTGFDVTLEPGGTIGAVYTKANSLYYRKFDLAGSPVSAELTVQNSSFPLLKPKIACIRSGTTFFNHVVFQEITSAVVYKLYYTRISPTPTVETTPTVLVDLTDKVDNPYLEKDEDDSVLFLSFENLSTTRVYLRQYLADTATLVAAPTQLGAPLELGDDTFSYISNTVLPVGGSSNTVIKRTANKDLFVFWLQHKGGGIYGIAVYGLHYGQAFGHKAIIKELVAPLEDLDAFDVTVDLNNIAHFIAIRGVDTVKATMDLTDLSVGVTATIDAGSSASMVATQFDMKGSLIHVWSAPSLGGLGNAAKSTSGVFNNMRGFKVVPSDIHLAYYRVSDSALAVAGRAVEEMPSISRLYELFNSVLGGSGQIAWNVLGTGVLSFPAAITIRIFNRVSEYTIAPLPGGITINPGEIAYVVIPDEDEPATVPLLKVPFGDGILDRYGRRAVPIFWNIGGDLYIRFAPFRLSSDQNTVIIGESISQQFIDFVGAGNSTPDPTNHAYLSTNYILQTDDHNTAIGKLDTEIGALAAEIASFLAASALEETQVVGAGGTTIFNCAGFTWNVDISSPDIQVYVNGLKVNQDTSGGLSEDFRKNSDSQLEFAYVVPEGSKITVRRQSVTIQPAQEEEHVVGIGGTTTFVCGSFTWSAGNSLPDIQVFVNGVKYIQDQTGGLNEDFRKTSTTALQFTNTVPAGSIILVRLERNSSGASVQVQDEGTTIATNLSSINFVGAGVTAVSVGPGQIQVTIPGAGGGAENIQKSVYNNTGLTIPAFSVLEWEADGSVGLADADSLTTSDFAGINLLAIPNATYGQVVKTGNIANALVGLGAAPGQEVYISAAAGGFTLVAPTGITQTIFKLGRAEPPTGFATPNANDLYLELEEVATP